MTHPFFHDASILVSVGLFLTHRFETVGVFAHFLCVKNAKTPSIWSSGQSSLFLLNSRQDVRIKCHSTIYNCICFYNHAVTDRNELARNCVGMKLHQVDDRSAQTQYFIYILCFRFWKHDAGNIPNSCIMLQIQHLFVVF